MSRKLRTPDHVIDELRSGMTIGIGGWGSRRKPMTLVRALARSDLEDLTIVTYGGPDLGILCATGKVAKAVYGFVSLDSIPLEPWFRKTREAARGGRSGFGIDVEEYDEGMLQLGLRAAAQRVPFLPTRAGLGSDVMTTNPHLQTVIDPYGGGAFVAMPALHLDAAFVHANRADTRGNAQFLGPDPYFDDLFCLAAKRAYVSAEEVVEPGELTRDHPVQTVTINRAMVHGVVEAPNGAHFTCCEPNYGRDEAFQRKYAATAKDDAAWYAFRNDFIDVSEQTYQDNVAAGRKQA